jgi:site-specific DNA recombinase
MNSAIYLRISAKESEEGQEDLAVQREKCEAMAILKGWDVVTVFTDQEASGDVGEFQRPGLAQLMDAIHGGDVDVVLVSSLDRLATRIELAISLILQISNYGSTFVSCKEAFDSSTPTGQYVLELFASLIHLELPSIESLADAVDGASEHLRERLPFGYIRVEGGLEIDIVKARIVRRLFELQADGYSLDEIALWLGFEGVPSPSGTPWTPSRVKRILDDREKYEGGIHADGVHTWPPIL